MAKQSVATGLKVNVRVVPERPYKPVTVEGEVLGDKDGFAIVRFCYCGLFTRFEVALDTVRMCIEQDRPIIY